MVSIKPFKGLRYNPLQINDLSEVTAPPYDVISPEQQDQLYQKHPNNIVRLILGKKFEGDDEHYNVYARASATLKTWQDEGVMQPETEPVIYAYNQSWRDEKGELCQRLGFIALLKLHPYSDNIVLPHEQTLSGPKVDRLNLTRATQTTLSPIFCLYNDPNMVVESSRFQEAADAAEPVSDADGVVHTFWPVTDKNLLSAVQEMLKNKPVVIADGHHRYETALGYQQEMREKLGDPTELGHQPYDYTLAFFCNTQSPGLKVYPTHRVFKQFPDAWKAESLIEAVSEHFDLIDDANCDNLKAAFWLKHNDSSKACILKNTDSIIKLPNELKDLDVAILDEVVIQQTMLNNANQLKQDGYLVFVRNDDEVKQLLKDGALVFWMKTPDIHQMETICQAGLKMPQKSTYFYPKLLSGLVCFAHKLAAVTA